MTPPFHLLAVNFRDPAHPEAGGAEQHLEEILREAVQRGMRVTWLASGFPGGAAEDTHLGMRIVRGGSWWNFNLALPGLLRRVCASGSPDLVVEDINKVPCFTPWWTRANVAVIVPHLFGTTVFREASFPVATYVLALEAMIPVVYRRARFLVISESTRDDLAARGIAPERVSVVHCGVDHTTYQPAATAEKTPAPTVLFVGRLRRYKGVDWLLRSFVRVRARVPGARLEVVGDGPDRSRLEGLAARRGAGEAVHFLGFLPRADLVARMRAAWVLVQPSPKEGWGLTVIEAGASGTAVVATDGPGLRDSVRREVSGLLVPFDDDQALADALVRVLTDAALRERLADGGRAWAERFTWSDCARRSLDVLTGAMAGGAA